MILVGDGEAAAAKRRLLERAGAHVVGEDAVAALAIVALDDPAEAEAAVARLRARNVLVNAVDRPVLCDYTLPAILDRDPVLVAIGTGGASAGLAKALRQRLEALLPPALGALARGLSDAKASIRRRWPDPAARRLAIDDALCEGGVLDPLVMHAPDAVQAWLDQPVRSAPRGLATLLLRSPDPDDLTLGQARLLGQADIVYHRADVPAAILDRARADARRVPCARPGRIEEGGFAVDIDWGD